mmetsp:Transcript_12678/g.36473  ORF Transcript_12678/g.36473 Transcript_12678/m.36473 type:complete len:238 (+) Transcript_12678:479-1192(+)
MAGAHRGKTSSSGGRSDHDQTKRTVSLAAARQSLYVLCSSAVTGTAGPGSRRGRATGGEGQGNGKRSTPLAVSASFTAMSPRPCTSQNRRGGREAKSTAFCGDQQPRTCQPTGDVHGEKSVSRTAATDGSLRAMGTSKARDCPEASTLSKCWQGKSFPKAMSMTSALCPLKVAIRSTASAPEWAMDSHEVCLKRKVWMQPSDVPTANHKGCTPVGSETEKHAHVSLALAAERQRRKT